MNKVLNIIHMLALQCNTLYKLYKLSNFNLIRFPDVVTTSDAESTTPGEPYEMKFTDTYGNIHVRDVDCPAVISRFFQESNCVDKHNQASQFELDLENK